MNRLGRGRRWPWGAGAAALLLLLGGAGFAAARWNDLRRWANDLRPAAALAKPDDGHGAACDGRHEAAAPANTVEVSEQGRRSIGLTTAEVALSEFTRTIVLPAMIVERPGRSALIVSAPVTGIVASIVPIRGQAVRPDDPLFELRMTHEDIVEKQSSLLRVVEELDVLNLEVARLEQVAASGALAGKTLLERRYERQRLEAALRADRQALVLHGLAEEQVASIIETRTLLPSLPVAAPSFPGHCSGHDDYFEVAQLFVKQGDHVQAGAPLAMLTDYCELYIEGRAFEHDAAALHAAIAENRPATALVEGPGGSKAEVAALRLLYVESRVDPESRALKFYVSLPNELTRNETTTAGPRFIAWRYRPGQRVEVLLPVEQWTNRIVLPVDAVVRDGVESFVFLQRGSRFDRTTVHVEHRDAQWAVLANDGTLFPGDAVAVAGAYQLHLALKTQAGGGVDPHAGCQH